MAFKYNRFNPYKILRFGSRIERIVKGEIPNPVEWVIYPSNICGYRCGHCIMAREQVDHRNFLSESAMSRIAGDARKFDIKCVIFSGGGDPLLNPRTNRSAKECKNNGIFTGINTQGYLMDDPSSYHFIRYSVDAATPDTYQSIHRVPRGDGWERVNENMRKHQYLRNRGEDIEMGIAFLITPKNHFETELFCSWAQQFRPDFIHLRPAYLDASYLQAEYPNGGEEIQKNIIPSLKKTAKKLEEKYGNVHFRIDKFEGYWTPKLYSKCRANPLMAVTSGDGAFLICQDRGIMESENYLRWGNYNEQSFEAIWWSKEHEKVMESIDLKNCPRCVENAYNEIIEHGFVDDKMKMSLL